MDDAYEDYLDGIASAATAFNTSNETAMSQAEMSVNEAIATLKSSIEVAEVEWTSTMTAAYNEFLSTNNSAWSQYTLAGNTAWGEYQTSLMDIRVQQQENLNVAWGAISDSVGLICHGVCGSRVERMERLSAIASCRSSGRCPPYGVADVRSNAGASRTVGARWADAGR